LAACGKEGLQDHNNIQSAEQIEKLIRSERKRQKILQQDLADLSGVSLHFLSNLENGKATVEFRKVLLVRRSLGIEMKLRTRYADKEVS